MHKKFTRILFTLSLLCTCILSMGCPQPTIPDLKYTVTFDVNGHGEPIKALEVNQNEVVSLVQLKDVDGYYFTGWLDGEEKVDNTHYTVTKDVKLTASWEKYLKVTFNDDIGNEKSPLTNIKKGYKLTKEDLKPLDSSNFIGWYLGDKAINEGYIVNTDLTLKAKRGIVQYYTLRFLDNTGKEIRKIDNIKQDTVVKYSDFPKQSDTDTKYFVGWQNGNQIIKDDITIEYDIDLKALYEDFITVNIEDGNGKITKTLTKLKKGYKLTKEDVPNLPDRETSLFKGWYFGETNVYEGFEVNCDMTINPKWGDTFTVKFIDSKSNGSKIFKNQKQGAVIDIHQIEDINNYTFGGWYIGENKVEGSTLTVNSDITLVAQWNPRVFKITYRLEAGEDKVTNPNPTTYVYGQDPIILKSAKREGYILDGWYIGDNSSSIGYTKIFEINSTMELESTITLYASWKKAVSIKFVDVNGKVIKNSESMKQNSLFPYDKFPKLDDTENEYFSGWYNGNVKVDKDFLVTTDTVLKAKFEKYLTVSFYDNDKIAKDPLTKLKKGYVLKSTDLSPLEDKDGVKFRGWYIGDNQIVEGTEVNSDMILNSLWGNTFTVSFDGKYINVSPIKDLDNNSKIEEPKVIYGAKLEGWYADGKKWDFTKDVITKDITLTAKWLPFTLQEATEYLKTVLTHIQDSIFDLHVNFTNNQEIKDLIASLLPSKCLKKVNLYFYSNSQLELTYEDFHIESDIPNLNAIYFMPNSVTKINDGALSGLNTLTSIHLNEGLTHIEFQAFADCTNLQEINIPNSVVSIKNQFLINSKTDKPLILKKIIFEDFVTQWEGKSIIPQDNPYVMFTPNQDSVANKNFICTEEIQDCVFVKLTSAELESRTKAKIQEAINNIQIPESVSGGVSNITLYSNWNEVKISWKSSDYNIINAQTGFVNHIPESNNKKVTLTATFTYNNISASKQYVVHVSNELSNSDKIFDEAFKQINEKMVPLTEKDIVVNSFLPNTIKCDNGTITVAANYNIISNEGNAKVDFGNKVVLARNLVDTKATLEIKLSYDNNQTTKTITVDIPKFTSVTWGGLYDPKKSVEIIGEIVTIKKDSVVRKYKYTDLDYRNRTFKLQLIDNNGKQLVDQPIVLYNYMCDEWSYQFVITNAYNKSKEWYEQIHGKYIYGSDASLTFDTQFDENGNITANNQFSYCTYNDSGSSLFKEGEFILSADKKTITENGEYSNKGKVWNVNYNNDCSIDVKEANGNLRFKMTWKGNNIFEDL